VQRRGPLPLREALQVMHHVAKVCELSEGQGLAHQNISPKSVMLTAGGETKLVAFTLGGALAGADPGDKLRFVAPERLRAGVEVDPTRADIYAFGATLHHVVMGRPPHPDLSDAEFSRKAKGGFLRPYGPRFTDAEGKHEPLDRLLTRTLELDPDARYGSMRELLKELETTIKAELMPTYAGPVESLFALMSAQPDGSTGVLGAGRRPKGLIAGSFEGDELSEFIQMIGLNQRTGSLRVDAAAGGSATIYVQRGSIVGGAAEAGDGLVAARLAARTKEGTFEFVPELPDEGVQIAPVPVSSFLLDLLRESDEQGRA
jgi:serine/threonine protein kinase